mgnify:CR=1 FL=1
MCRLTQHFRGNQGDAPVRHVKAGAVSIRVFAGIMLGIAFHMLNGLFSSLGAINDWPPFWSAITPSGMFLLAAGGMLWWVERR